MKIFGGILAVFLGYAYFIDRDIGVNLITPLFNTVFPWIGAAFILFLVWFANRDKADELQGKAKEGATKLVGMAKPLPMKWVWLIVAVLAAGMAFYWFSVRPEGIRKDCYETARINAYYGGDESYQDCLRKHGQ